MAINYNSPIATENLVFCLDANNKRSISPLGCRGFNGAPQLIKNLVSPGQSITSTDSLKLSNVDYYTAFAINYPEGSFGGDAAGRDGITPGFNVRSGTKTFNFARSLNLAVWDKNTETFVKQTVYDNHGSAAELDRFITEYNETVANYPNAIYIVAGSHRDSRHSAAKYEILKDLGAPSDVDSIINFSAPEWILVGEPGLGPDNAYGWAFQNYTTDPTHVAHLNFCLPVYGTETSALEFNGSDTTLVLPNPIGTFSKNNFHINMWINPSNQTGIFLTPQSYGIDHFLRYVANNEQVGVLITETADVNGRGLFSTAGSVPESTWTNVAINMNDLNIEIYINGVLNNSRTETIPVAPWTGDWDIGQRGNNTNWFTGKISHMSVYDRILTANEIKNNYDALKWRYGL